MLFNTYTFIIIISTIVPNPVIAILPINETAVGRDFQLSCTVISDTVHDGTTASIEWRRNDKVINSSTVPIVVTEQFYGTLLYNIDGTSLVDSGVYHCAAQINKTNNTPFLISSDTVENHTTIHVKSKSEPF